ncbi:MAG TPA: M1 family aminopeptidase [Candidatus Angelobacter sp.]|nr:M1 family aminopeptidase [Candidatus Angelobacter sp.]
MRLSRIWVFIIMAALPLLAVGQRLPGGVTPDHYDVTFTPDLAKASFAGEETIQVKILNRTSTVTLNSIEIEIQEASITQGETTQPAQMTFAPEQEQVKLDVPAALEAGPASIHIKFTGTLNDKLRGFYLAKTRLRNYAVTQFEATDARRAFPSFDEPALKATFAITLIIDRADTAISNGHIMADVSGPGADKHTVKFSTTPKMSTYLVAMAVGDFECSESRADNVPIRVCGTTDKKPLQAAALRYAGEILKYYNQYYGTPYPFGKLDIVGAPDFEAGAMENTAAIFYRESLLFIDDKNSSVESHQAVFEVLAHEMAHQWFGDLVTMKWWDNIWLNEGFATWMALKPSQALHPEWNATLDAVKETDQALTLDALTNTHPIRAKAETPDEINELFDPISYQKGASVLRMVEAYVSPEVFRRGVNSYLRKFAYSNASSEDFWTAIMIASGGRPVDKIMPGFVEQPGEPLVKVQAACITPPQQPASKPKKGKRARRPIQAHPKTEITLSQERFFGDGKQDTSGKLWTIPVCIKSGDNKPFCQLLSEKRQVVPMVGCAPWVFTNANAVGYYRTQYDPELLRKLTDATRDLSTAERISLVQDESALVKSGSDKVGSLLDLISALSSDQENSVVDSYVPALELINNYLVTPSDREAFHAWIRVTFRPMMAKVMWKPMAGESDDTKELRAALAKILGLLGEDPDAVRESTKLARQYLQDPQSVDATLARVVLRVAARYGDSQLLDDYLAALKRMDQPEQFYNVGGALSDFRGDPLVERVLQVAVSEETRSQDAPFAIAAVLGNPDNQNFAWPWVKAHWPDVEKKVTMSSGAAIVAAARYACDAGTRDDVQKFFAEHKVASSERVLKQATENIDACINLRNRQQNSLASWLEQHPANGIAGNR